MFPNKNLENLVMAFSTAVQFDPLCSAGSCNKSVEVHQVVAFVGDSLSTSLLPSFCSSSLLPSDKDRVE
jgi:hypothetical protein